MLMPGSEISQLSDFELVEAARANSDDRTQRQIQAEMWRRTTLEARRADLTASERGRRGQTIALWAIEVALLAGLFSLLVVGGLNDFGGGYDPAWGAGAVVAALASLGNLMALLASANAQTVARTRLRQFDAEFFHGP
ncbi:MAG: hypothetical protein ABSB36_08990 [Candidatus Dormibacteria bacterium]|jgi:Flp pilus assembly pilin Flp